MQKLQILTLLTLLIKCIYSNNLTIKEQEKAAENYLKEITPTLEKNLMWMYENNFKDKTKLSLVEQISLEYDNEEVNEFFKKLTDHFKKYQFEKFNNTDLSRQILLLISRDERVLSVKERQEFLDIQEKSKHFFKNVKFCDRNEKEEDCDMNVKDILELIMMIDDEDESGWYWREFAQKVGKNRRDSFNRYVELYRKIANLNGFEKATHLILAEYEDYDIVKKMDELVEALKPLYLQFHAYFRNQLRQMHGDKIPEKGPIPFKFLFTYYLYSEILTGVLEYPFPDSAIPDYDNALQAQNYTPQILIQEADEFFTSMGISSALTKDWKDFIRHDSEAEEEGTCEPKAKSYLAKGSLTFTYCNDVDFRNFYNTHAQMLVVQQYNHGKNLPLVYRTLFPPAFEQALEKSMKFAVSTPNHMIKIGVIDGDDVNQQVLLNRLYLLAFKVIVGILQGYSETLYFHNILDGNYNTSNSNCEFWRLQQNFLGIRPFKNVSNEDFDYVASTTENFHDKDFEEIVARFAAFNIYESFCKISGNYEKGSETQPLNNCDFSGNHDIGRLLTKVMKIGASKPWHKVFTGITLKDSIDASSILEYFEPLRIFLENENKKNGVYIGWEPTEICE